MAHDDAKGTPSTVESSTDLPGTIAQALHLQSKSVERLQTAVMTSAIRLEQAFQGLSMRVDLLESSLEDAIRALREVQTTVASQPLAIGVDYAALDQWSGQQADAVTAVEKQLVTISGQLDSLRRRIPLRARPPAAPPVQLDPAAIDAIAEAVARRTKS